MFSRLRRRSHEKDIDPDQIFLDDKNLPDFDVHQFEGRIESPISRGTIVILGAAFLFVGMIFLGRIGFLQIKEGKAFAEKSENNRLDHQLLFPERGVIKDRNGVPLAWNTAPMEDLGFSLRSYVSEPGFSHVLGFLHYPARDKSGVYYRKDYETEVGVEDIYNELLRGRNGLQIIETDALGNVISANTIDPPVPGRDVTLAIDARVQNKFYETIGRIAREQDYLGGAGGIMDIQTGEILAIVSYPEFDSNVMTSGDDADAIDAYNSDKRTPFLNRAVSGLFAPGSIVKPMFAIGGLNEGIITPTTPIYSSGYVEIPNPYFPEKPTRFNDWKAHGMLDMRSAISQSSNVYFYEIAGGFEGQRGLGIRNVEKYARMFGYGSTTGIDLSGEVNGTIPNPEWKKKNFPEDPTWRIGDTYFTGIGQYGMQATLVQALLEASIIASRGTAVVPHVATVAATSSRALPIPNEYFSVAQEGMRKAVLSGTANTLNIDGVNIAAKTGTAELGVSKARVNSWVIGFFPYEKPRYAFAVVMDRGVKGNATNASVVASQLLQWMVRETPEHIR
jgi:penicillin-binding protein 2